MARDQQSPGAPPGWPEAVAPGAHLGLFHDSRDGLADAAAWFTIGLARQELCLALVADEADALSLRTTLTSQGVDVAATTAGGQLLLQLAADGPLARPVFDPQAAVASLRQQVENGLAAGFPGVRAMALMHWANDTRVDDDALGRFELLLTAQLADLPVMLLCVYDRRRIAVERQLRALDSHPWIVHDGVLCRNPRYLPAEQQDTPGQPAAALERRLTALAAAARAAEHQAAIEADYRALVEAANSMILKVDVAGQITYVNAATERALGQPAAELLGRQLPGTLVPPVDSHGRRQLPMLSADRPVADDGTPLEAELTRADGTRFWISFTLRAQRDATGEVSEYIAIGHDITVLKEVEQALRESEERHRKLVDTSPDLIAVVQDQRFVYVNPAGALIFGVESPAELVGRLAPDQVHPDQRELVRRRLSVAHGDGTNPRIVLRVGPPGRDCYRTVETVSRPILYHGRPAALIVAHDLTERLQAEQALRESEERYRAVFESTRDGVLLETLEGRIVDANSEAARMHGYTREELLDLPVDALLSPSARDSFATWAERHQLDGGTQFECDNQHRDGHHFPVEVTTVPFPLHGHELVLVHLRDISRRRWAQAQRQQLEQRLREAEKLESLVNLAGGVAHDFNNLLTSIIGHASLALAEPGVSERVCSSLQEIQGAGQQAAQLAAQMLAYSGGGRFFIQPVDLSALVAERVAAQSPPAPGRIEVTCELSAHLPPTEATRDQLAQVVDNLLVNAVEAIPGTGSIAVATGLLHAEAAFLAECQPQGDHLPGPYLFLTVTDTGVGIQAAHLPRIFDPFFTTKFVGRGLGLAVVLGIVRAHRGLVRTVSSPGSGTTQQVLLPCLPP